MPSLRANRLPGIVRECGHTVYEAANVQEATAHFPPAHPIGFTADRYRGCRDGSGPALASAAGAGHSRVSRSFFMSGYADHAALENKALSASLTTLFPAEALPLGTEPHGGGSETPLAGQGRPSRIS